jgi:tetratricopeptide (TPR) repeat protein
LDPTDFLYPYAVSQIQIGQAKGDAKVLGLGEKNLISAIQLKPNQTEPYVGLVQLYDAENRLQEEGQVLQALLQVNPQDASVHYALALLLERLKDKEGAIRELKTVVTLDPKNTAAAQLLETLKQPAKEQKDKKPAPDVSGQ